MIFNNSRFPRFPFFPSKNAKNPIQKAADGKPSKNHALGFHLGLKIEENRCPRHQKFRKSQENLHFSPIAFLRDFCNRLYRHGSGKIEIFLLPLICHQPVGYTGESEGRASLGYSNLGYSSLGYCGAVGGVGV